MPNRISVLIDVATDKAVAGLKGFKQSIAEADGAFGKIKAGGASAFDSVKANAGLAGVAVVGAVGAMAAKSIDAASKLGESVNAVNVTFGQSAEGIKALGEEAAEAVGLSNAEFNGLAVQFSSFAETIAGKGGDVVGTIDEMTTRASDFASVMNVDVADAAAMFQSGLAGETEPLKKFGIDLSAAKVEAYAYAEGITEVGAALTESEKVQARYGLLMEQTAKTSGDFAETSDGLANSQRILAAKLEDTAAKVGKQLAPAMAHVTTVLSDIIPIAGNVAVFVGKSFEKMVDGAYAMGEGFANVVDALPFVDMKGPIAETLYEQEKLERGTADLVAEYAKGAPTMDEFVKRLNEQDLSQHAVNLAIIEYRKQLDATTDTGDEYVEMQEGLKGALDDSISATDDFTGANKLLEDQIRRTDDAYSDLKGELHAEEDFLAAEGMWADLQQSAVDSYNAAAEGAEDAGAKAADHKQKVIDAKLQVIDLGEKYKDLPEEEITRIVALIDEGKLAEAEAALNNVTRNRTMNVSITANGGFVPVTGTQGGIRFGADGGIVTRPTLAVIGEAGPEAVMPLNQAPGASPLPSGLGEGSTINLYVTAGAFAGGQEIGDVIIGKIREYERRNGPAWRR